jgi:hypothetical protein
MGKGQHIGPMPELGKPILILAFAGWANGGNVAVGMVDYLIQRLRAEVDRPLRIQHKGALTMSTDDSVPRLLEALSEAQTWPERFKAYRAA